jgi:hypothetical protein
MCSLSLFCAALAESHRLGGLYRKEKPSLMILESNVKVLASGKSCCAASSSVEGRQSEKEGMELSLLSIRNLLL